MYTPGSINDFDFSNDSTNHFAFNDKQLTNAYLLNLNLGNNRFYHSLITQICKRMPLIAKTNLQGPQWCVKLIYAETMFKSKIFPSK